MRWPIALSTEVIVVKGVAAAMSVRASIVWDGNTPSSLKNGVICVIEGLYGQGWRIIRGGAVLSLRVSTVWEVGA